MRCDRSNKMDDYKDLNITNDTTNHKRIKEALEGKITITQLLQQSK